MARRALAYMCLRLRASIARSIPVARAGARFTCVTGTKVQILTRLRASMSRAIPVNIRLFVLCLLALLVQKYKYWRKRRGRRICAWFCLAYCFSILGYMMCVCVCLYRIFYICSLSLSFLVRARTHTRMRIKCMYWANEFAEIHACAPAYASS